MNTHTPRTSAIYGFTQLIAVMQASFPMASIQTLYCVVYYNHNNHNYVKQFYYMYVASSVLQKRLHSHCFHRSHHPQHSQTQKTKQNYIMQNTTIYSLTT